MSTPPANNPPTSTPGQRVRTYFTHTPYLKVAEQQDPQHVQVGSQSGPEVEVERRSAITPTTASAPSLPSHPSAGTPHAVSTRSPPTDSSYVGVGGDLGRGISSSSDVNLASSGLMSQQQQFSVGRGSGTTTPQSFDEQHPPAQRRPRGGSMHGTSGALTVQRPPISIDQTDIVSPQQQPQPQAFTQSVTTSATSSQSASPVSGNLRGRSPIGVAGDSPYEAPLRGGSGIRRGSPRYRATSPPQNAVHIALLHHELEYYLIPAPMPITEEELVQSTGVMAGPQGYQQGLQAPIPSRGRSPQPFTVGEPVVTVGGPFSPFAAQVPSAPPAARATESPGPKPSGKGGKHDIFIGQVKYEISPDVMALIVSIVTQGAVNPRRVFPRGNGCFLASLDNEEQCSVLTQYNNCVLFDEAGFWVARRTDQQEALAAYCNSLKDTKLKVPKQPMRLSNDATREKPSRPGREKSRPGVSDDEE